MRMSMSTMMVTTHREHSEEINGKPNRANEQQLAGIHFWGLQQALDSFKHNKNRY